MRSLRMLLVFILAVVYTHGQVGCSLHTQSDIEANGAKQTRASSLSTLFSGLFSNEPTVLGVLDGDSIRISAPFLPHPLSNTLILRLRGVDAPEMGWRAGCTEESEFAVLASNGSKRWIRQRSMRIELTQWDKYGGRVLGDVIDINTSERLTDWLLTEGLVLPYNGRKRPNWCLHLAATIGECNGNIIPMP